MGSVSSKIIKRFTCPIQQRVQEVVGAAALLQRINNVCLKNVYEWLLGHTLQAASLLDEEDTHYRQQLSNYSSKQEEWSIYRSF